jgi:serine/threonine protein kinase/tetratricopeptide (TPR) repeat protein
MPDRSEVTRLSQEMISHYRIINQLGAGGMGEVYLAEDTRLQRQVAIKFLPASYQYDPARRTRFMAEARATSALRSPHIAAIYDIGEHEGAMFIVMEFVEGEPLSSRIERGSLATADVIEIAAQIADALAEAHKLEIVHCDIKSSNVLINERGFVKILDFGIARSCEPEDREPPDVTREIGRQTSLNAVEGTVSYMSPEQALGRELDSRSDIFSLGVVMYEMLAGRLPFEGDNIVEMIDRIIHEEPPSVSRFNHSVPAELERIVRKCMEKEPARRYQSAIELSVDLRNLQRDGDTGSRPTMSLNRPTQVVRRPRSRRRLDSLAILPLVNLSGDPEMEYLSDGITESLIINLSRVPRLRVMARSTVFRYKRVPTGSLPPQEEPLDPQEVGRDLGVRAIVVGRVLLRGDTLVIKTELVDTDDGSHLWGGQFNRTISDIFEVEEEIASEISDALRLRLTGAQKEGLARRYPENTEAYQLYLKGRYHWNKRTEEGIKKSITYFERAIQLDSKYTLAYAGLADAYNLLAGYGSMPPRTAFLRAKATALKALSLDENLAEAQAALAHVRYWYEWDWDGAERGFRRSIELNPDYATAHLWYSLLLAAMERFDEAFIEITRAEEAEPLSLVINFNLGRILYFARQYDEAEKQCLKTLEIYPNFFLGYRRLGMIYTEKLMYEEAEAQLKRSLELSPDNSETLSALGYNYAVWGRTDDARRVLDDLVELAEREYVSPYSYARIYLGLGKIEEAFEWLEKAYQERHGILVYLKVEPIFDNVREDSRYLRLLRRMGLLLEAHAAE